jgi:N-acetylglucosaminyldiphosphoundecaprenol N-acetyl-beta-D-mannosaminyltransferase
MKTLSIGTLHSDYVSMTGAVDYIERLAIRRKGGYVVTPNVDHIVMAETNEALRKAYDDASLSLADGMPLVWLSKICGCSLPGKVSGSDLVRPLLVRAAGLGFKVYLLGAAPGIGLKAAARLRSEIPGLHIVGVDSPPPGFEQDREREEQVLELMQAHDPDIVLVALGAPKQEILMHRWYHRGVTAVMLGIGASIDFIAGTVQRAPAWMSNAGLEWFYRLAQDPRRLAKRYVLRDSGFVPIAYRMLMKPREELVEIKETRIADRRINEWTGSTYDRLRNTDGHDRRQIDRRRDNRFGVCRSAVGGILCT